VPFELTHLAVGLALKKHPSADYLAGLVYPDIRYPAGIDRNLTHSLEPIKHLQGSDFYRGVKTHLDADACWDNLVLNDIRLKMVADNEERCILIGVYKLIHDTVAFPLILNKHMIIDNLRAFKLPEGLPISHMQWQEWMSALCLYLEEGPTHTGLLHIVTSTKFQTKEAFVPRLALLDQLSEKYQNVFVSVHRQLVRDIQDYARIA
jgi:hypothetical protein